MDIINIIIDDSHLRIPGVSLLVSCKQTGILSEIIC